MNSSMNYKHIIWLDDLGLISLQPIVVCATGCGRAQNNRSMIQAWLFANFPMIIHKTMNQGEGFSMVVIQKNEGTKNDDSL